MNKVIWHIMAEKLIQDKTGCQDSITVRNSMELAIHIMNCQQMRILQIDYWKCVQHLDVLYGI
jgi:hypothetical protein